MNPIKRPHFHPKKHGERYLAEANPLKVVLGLAIPSFFAQLVNVFCPVFVRTCVGQSPVTGAAALAGDKFCNTLAQIITSRATCEKEFPIYAEHNAPRLCKPRGVSLNDVFPD